MNFSAVILAGGKSSRMGHDKAWLEVGGRPLLTRQIQLVRETGAVEIFISGRAGKDYSEFDCPVLHDRFNEAGPLAGIERALAVMSSSWLLVLAVDMPNLTPAILQELAERSVGTAGVIPRVDRRIEPLAAIYPKAAWDLAAALLEHGSAAAKVFAGRCVQSGLANFYDLDRRVARSFASWNAPLDVVPVTVRQPRFQGAAPNRGY